MPDPVSAVVFGFAAGIFLHLAVDFLPGGGKPGEGEPGRRKALHATVSAIAGIVAVVLAWVLVSNL